MAYGSSQARVWTGAIAAGMCHSHSNAKSKPHLTPIPQLTATPDPQLTEWGQGSNPHHHGCYSDLFPMCHKCKLPIGLLLRKTCKRLFFIFFLIVICLENKDSMFCLNNFLCLGVPVVAQWKRIWLASTKTQVRFLASLSGLRIQHCSDLWCRSQTWLGTDMAVAVA